MPTPTYDLIASNVLSSATSSVTFSSIPATYRDLIVVALGVSTGDFSNMFIRFNADTGSNYNAVYMTGNGSSTGSSAPSNQTSLYIANNAAYAANGNAIQAIISIMDYSATDKHKTVLARSNAINASFGGTEAVAGRWASTSAINSVEIRNQSGNGFLFASGSTFYLYGIVS